MENFKYNGYDGQGNSWGQSIPLFYWMYYDRCIVFKDIYAWEVGWIGTDQEDPEGRIHLTKCCLCFFNTTYCTDLNTHKVFDTKSNYVILTTWSLQMITTELQVVTCYHTLPDFRRCEGLTRGSFGAPCRTKFERKCVSTTRLCLKGIVLTRRKAISQRNLA